MAMVSRSSMPQFPPWAQTVSYSGCLVRKWPSLSLIGARTADDAAPVAAVGGQAAPAGLQFGLGLAADLGRPVEPALLEVVGRIAAGLVEDVGQDIGSVGGEPLAGDRVLLQAIDPYPGWPP